MVLLVIIWFWGTSFVNVLGLLSSDNSDSSTNNSGYTLPLQKPDLSRIESPTNQDKINIEGTTTANAEVILLVNGNKVGEQKAEKGSFKFTAVTLKEGINQVIVTAKDSTGAEETTRTSVVLDKTAPTLTVTAPANNASFPSSTKSVTVSGTSSDPEGVVFINSIQATIDPQTGNFSFNLPIGAGTIEIEIKAFDAAGNSVSQKRTVTVSKAETPPPPPIGL